jgi:hypothetical protein
MKVMLRWRSCICLGMRVLIHHDRWWWRLMYSFFFERYSIVVFNLMKSSILKKLWLVHNAFFSCFLLVNNLYHGKRKILIDPKWERSTTNEISSFLGHLYDLLK